LFNNIGVIGMGNIDITPEFAARLATAYAATLDNEGEVVVSADSYKISNSLKKALTGGLQAAGIKVVDIGETVTPVSRYSISNLQTKGGIHVRVSYEDPQNMVIEFLNKHGANITTGEQKSIEKKFFAEDYNRVKLENIGDYSFAPEMNKGYLQSLLDNLDKEIIKRNYFSLVIDYEYDNLLDLLPVFLKNLNCQIISTRNFSYNGLPMRLSKRLEIKERVGRIIRDNKSDMGLIIDHNAEQLNLVNFKGEVLDKAQHQVLVSYILLEKGIKNLYLPLNAPRVIENMASRYDAEINYTPIRPQFSMNKHLNNNQEKSSFFYPYADALYSLGLLLEKMARDNISLTGLIEKLPDFYLKETEIKCDWEDKGKVMRNLTENAENQAELIDGIKFNHENGWALVIPDSEQPVFHVFAEGNDAEVAESLTGFYSEKVEKIISG